MRFAIQFIMTKTNQPRLGWSFTYQLVEGMESLPSHQDLERAFQNKGASRYVFQLEAGTKQGRHHYQGCVVFDSPITGREFRELIKSYTRKVYCAGCLTYSPTHSLDDSEIYCQKTEGRLMGPYYWPPAHKRYRGQDIIRLEDMYPWQEFMHDSTVCCDPHPRHVYCIVDPTGNSGKSVFTKMMTYLYPDEVCVVPLGLSAQQIKTALVSQGMKKIYLIDIPRNNKSVIDLMDCIEELKRGLVISSFYGKFNQLMMPRPHIILFANHMPKMRLLSMDMWKVYSINANKELVPHDAYEVDLAQKADKFRNQKDKPTDFELFFKEYSIDEDEIIF